MKSLMVLLIVLSTLSCYAQTKQAVVESPQRNPDSLLSNQEPVKAIDQPAMEGRHWLEYVTAFGAVATPIFVLLLTGVGWRLRQKFERQLELEDKLRSDRIEIYNKILEPFIVLFISDEAWKQNKKNRNTDKVAYAKQILFSLDYRIAAFMMSLIGSDEVVTAYNDLFQYFYQNDQSVESSPASSKEMLKLLGNFLLEVRRSMGNEATKLKWLDMLEWWLKEARAFRD